MRKLSFLLPATVLVLLSSSVVWSHDGHDHDAPVMESAPKGGVLKSLEFTKIEVVSKGKDLRVYLYDLKLAPKPVTGFTVKAKAELPRAKKVEDVTLTVKDTSFEGSFDAKGLHRYTLLLFVKDPKTGNEDKLTYVIEPRK